SDDGKHTLLAGTSQAAPFVAGAVALLFEQDPSLTALQVTSRLTLQAGRAIEMSEGEAWSPAQGFGILAIDRALRAPVRALSPDATKSGFSMNFTHVAPSGTGATAVVIPRDAQGAPLGPGHDVTVVPVVHAAGVRATDLGDGSYAALLPVSALPVSGNVVARV